MTLCHTMFLGCWLDEHATCTNPASTITILQNFTSSVANNNWPVRHSLNEVVQYSIEHQQSRIINILFQTFFSIKLNFKPQ